MIRGRSILIITGHPIKELKSLTQLKENQLIFFMTAGKMLTPQSTLCINSKTLKNRNHGKIPLVV